MRNQFINIFFKDLQSLDIVLYAFFYKSYQIFLGGLMYICYYHFLLMGNTLLPHKAIIRNHFIYICFYQISNGMGFIFYCVIGLCFFLIHGKEHKFRLRLFKVFIYFLYALDSANIVPAGVFYIRANGLVVMWQRHRWKAKPQAVVSRVCGHTALLVSAMRHIFFFIRWVLLNVKVGKMCFIGKITGGMLSTYALFIIHILYIQRFSGLYKANLKGTITNRVFMFTACHLYQIATIHGFILTAIVYTPQSKYQCLVFRIYRNAIIAVSIILFRHIQVRGILDLIPTGLIIYHIFGNFILQDPRQAVDRGSVIALTVHINIVRDEGQLLLELQYSFGCIFITGVGKVYQKRFVFHVLENFF
ncbi:pH359L [African swine fever virus]|uniref:PH359L n=1 Tax=African swine fever virus TaxID=10497 RepID=A0A8A1V631_ASF|nr:pH359L [African swine fever virus]